MQWSNASDLIILHSTVTGFKEGSERKRNVATFGGETSIAVHCKFTERDGKALLERDITGKGRLIGDNLKATDDFAKTAATVAPDNFSSDHSNSKSST